MPEVEELCAKILLTFPDCTTKTLEELRKPKLEAWNRNKEDSRAWLGLNMMTEARAGFTAFNEGTKDDREVDFVLLRQKLAAGEPGSDRCTIQSSRRRSVMAETLGTRPTAAPRRHRYGSGSTRDGALLRLRLNAAEGQYRRRRDDRGACRAFASHRNPVRPCVACCSTHEGPNFSFGASVEEHLPAQCAQMLASLHALIIAMIEFPAPILVAVRGQCLGGGLELALAGGPIFAAPDAQFGQPEMKLGVFAPAASVLLPYRVNQPMAEDLLFSGRSIDGAGGAPPASCSRCPMTPTPPRWRTSRGIWRARVRPRWPARSQRRGARLLRRRTRARLAEVEQLYLERLMATRDANEGLRRSSRSAHLDGSTGKKG
jgi:cyclohexa-1,5-dienecarbonyl-CoA hydratase